MRAVRRVFIPAGSLIFFAGLLLSAVIYYSDKPFDFKRSVISNLARPTDNPHGYLAAALGIAGCGLLLVPAAIWFHRVLRTLHAGVAAAGLLLFGAGLAGSVFIGVMSPFQDAYSDIHIYVAYATFLLMSAGVMVWLTMATIRAFRAGRGGKLLIALIAQAWIMGFLLYLTVALVLPFGPDFFDDSSFFRTSAFCEWLLCAGNVTYLYYSRGGGAADRETGSRPAASRH